MRSRRIEVRDGALVTVPRPGTTYPLAPIRARAFIVPGMPVRVVFAFNENASRLTITQGNQRPIAMERFDPVPAPTAAELDDCVGTYGSDEGLADLQVIREGETLSLHVLHREALALRPVMADRFVLDADIPFSILFERSGGRVTGLILEGGLIFGVAFTKR